MYTVKCNFRYTNRANKVLRNIVCSIVFFTLFAVYFMPLFVHAEDNPLEKLREETLSYFKPLTGTITKLDNNKIVINLGAEDAVKEGMRFTILRKESAFKHPVTKEILGTFESVVGKLDIQEVDTGVSMGILIEGDAKEGDTVRISEKKVNILFCQSKGIDWFIADSYYRKLKESGRVHLIDTDIETDDPLKAIEAARRLHTEAVLLFTARAEGSSTLLQQKLFWTSDGSEISKIDIKLDVAFMKDFRVGEEFFTPYKEAAWIQIELPYAVKLLRTADVNGDGQQEIILSTGTDIQVYIPGSEFQPACNGCQIKGSSLDDHLWLDSIDLNGNGKDEIIITSMKGDEIISSIYELRGTEFSILYKDEVFLRKVGDVLIAQAYSSAEGFSGEIFTIIWEGEYKRGDALRLTKGVNIYDFIYFNDPNMGKLVLAYDEKGFLSLYDSQDTRIWKSMTDTGGFVSTFKRSSPSVSVDRGEWSIKDRLTLRNREVLFVKRIPLLNMVKGLGYKSSQIKRLRWNGLSMEEGLVIDDIKGSVLDYAVTGDKIIVLTSPMFGIKPGNILKGESPLKTVLYMYSIKGI